MLFSMYPSIIVNIDGKTTTVTDIFRRVSVNKFSDNYSFLETVTIPDGFTPEQVSDKFYNRPDYHWTLLIVNDIVDVRKEWPMSSADLVKYCKKKYGETGMYEIHHYRTTDENKYIVDQSYEFSKDEITNIQYEEELNDAKREIKVISTKYISEFVNYYTKSVR